MNKIALTLLSVYLATHLAACTSKESREDEATASAEETVAGDGELENVESTGETAADATSETTGAASGDEANAGFVDEQLPDQTLGSDATASTDAPPADVTTETPAVDAGATGLADATSETAPAPEVEPAPAPDTSTAMAPAETLSNETSPAVDPGTEKPAEVAAVESKPKASLKKIWDAPRTENGQLLNTVYIARPGDNYKKIAQNIYGDASRQADLKKANPSIKSPKAGDKVYYNSPHRPTDDTAMKTFFEDNGAGSEVYVAKEGDDLKKVSKDLLGYDNAWKEVWVTNRDVESKGELAAGTELRYWKAEPSSFAASTANVAKNEMAGSGDLPPPPPTDMNNMAANDLPPPPPPTTPEMDATGAGSMMADAPPPPPPAEMAPPPPPPIEMAPPPPPPPVAQAAPHMGEDGGMSNDDMMMGLAAVGIVAAGVAAIMVMRKRRQQREMASAFGDTQVGAS